MSMALRGAAVWFGWFVLLATPRVARAQCNGEYLAGSGLPGLQGPAAATTVWAPSGPGSEVVVIAGQFSVAGDTLASGLATWDGTNWQPLGGTSSSPPSIVALAVYQGQLYACGSFPDIGGLPVATIARWNGTTWTDVGGTVAGNEPYTSITSLFVHEGSLIVGGSFTSVGGVNASCIARWDGAAWHPLGAGMDQPVDALAVYNGQLVAGGRFTLAGGAAAARIARWDGAQWSPLGIGVNGSVQELAAYGGSLIAGGEFTTAGGVNASHVARWNGTTWATLGTGLVGGGILLNVQVTAMQVYGGGLVVSGRFMTAGGVSASGIASWNGTTWAALGAGLQGSTDPHASGLSVFGTDLIAAGSFSLAGPRPVRDIARWDGSNWNRIGSGFDGAPTKMIVFQDRLVAGSGFRVAPGPGGVEARAVAAFDGVDWTPLGTGLDGYIQDLAIYNGALVAGGAFVSGGTGNARVAQWNGASWQVMGNGLGLANGAHRVTSLAVYQNQLYAGGWFQSGNGQNVVEGIARWDGSSWRAVGGRMIGEVHALLVHNGELIAGGIFSQAGGQPISGIARWNGTSWQPLGTGITGSAGVYALATYNGDLIAGGRFFSVGGVNTGHIARWDGAAWQDMQGGLSGGFSTTVWDLAVFNGDLIVVGEFTNAGGVPVSWLARWNGAWSAQESGLSSAAAGLGIFHGELCVAGGFMTAGPRVSALFARWSPTGVPWIARQPAGSQVAPGGTAQLSLAAATGYSNLGYRWRRGGVELSDGPTAHGSTILGAATPALTVENVGGQDAGSYDCIVSSPCGSVTSAAAALTVPGGCYANCDGSTVPPVLNVNDFACFLNSFAAGAAYANCDQSTTAPVLNVQDFACFLNAYAAGCS